MKNLFYFTLPGKPCFYRNVSDGMTMKTPGKYPNLRAEWCLGAGAHPDQWPERMDMTRRLFEAILDGEESLTLEELRKASNIVNFGEGPCRPFDYLVSTELVVIDTKAHEKQIKELLSSLTSARKRPGLDNAYRIPSPLEKLGDELLSCEELPVAVLNKLTDELHWLRFFSESARQRPRDIKKALCLTAK